MASSRPASTPFEMAARRLTPRERAWLRRGITLTEEQYAAMLDAQGGLCWLCGRPPSPHQALAPDHDHKTGVVRGLLCHECNRRIVGTLDHYGPARRTRVIMRLARYYDIHISARDYRAAEQAMREADS